MQLKNEQGFTYLEVIVAMTIMLLLFAFSSQLNATTFKIQHQDQVKMQMLYFAQGELEEYQYDLQTNRTLAWPIHSDKTSTLPDMSAAQVLPAAKSPTGLSEIMIKVTSPSYFSGNTPVYVTGYNPFPHN